MKTHISNPFRSHPSITAAISVALFGHFATPSASAVDYYWDSDGVTAGFGTAAGIWTDPTSGDATQGWSTSTAGELLPSNVTISTADTVSFGFGATGLGAGTIAVAGSVSAGNITFASGSGAIVVSGGTIINQDAQRITVNSATHTISSVMGGAATTFLIQGSGTVALSNPASTFVGRTVIGNNIASTLKLQVTKLANLSANSSLGAPTTIANGLIQIGAGSQPSTLELIGSTSASSTNRQVRIGVSANGSGGATILNNNPDAAHTLTFSNAAFNQAATGVTSSSRALTLGGSNTGNNTITGAIVSNTGGPGLTSLVKTGSGNWILNGANSYNGNTTVNDGILILGGSNSKDTSTAVNATGTLQLRSNSNGGLASGNLIFNSSAAVVQASNADRSITNQAVLNADGTISGDFSLTLGNLLVSGDSRVLTNNIISSKSLTVASISANGDHNLSIDGAGSTTVTGSASLGAGTLTQNTGGQLKFSSAGTNDSDVIVNGGAGAGALVATLEGQHVSTGSLTLENSASLVIDYGSFIPSSAVAPLAVNDFNVGTDLSLLVEGSAISNLAVGQSYPLVTWAASGPSDDSAFTTVLTHRLAGTFSVSLNTLFLNVTANAAGSPISWSGGSGPWDTSSPNWVDGATSPASTTYFDTLDAVLFGDAADVTGNPVITLDRAVAPVGVTMNSENHDYTISGTGGIGGVGGLLLSAANTRMLTLATANTYAGKTTVSGGILKLENANALPGGIAATGGTSSLSISGGVVGLTEDFLRARGTGVAQVQWTASGGFAAYGGDRTVNLGGSGATMTWNNSGFVPGGGGALILSAADADGTLIWQNPISFAGSVRTIQVNNGSADVDARLIGALSAGTSSGLNKTGAGTLEITNTSNSYAGATTVSAGTLQLGASNVLPNTTNVTIAAATLDIVAGVTDSTGTGTLDVTDAVSTIKLGNSDSQISFADSSGVDWTGGTLNITGTFVPGNGVDPGSLRFGTDSGGLTSGPGGQLSQITASGWTNFALDENGYLTATEAGGYSAWQAANGTTQTADQDHDNDGVNNSVEFFIGGTTNTTGFNSLPGVNTVGGLSVTWTKHPTYTGSYGSGYVVETSATLTGPWTTELNPGPTISFPTANEVKFTFPTPLGAKNFARLKVTP
jgi:fibronectin-binding autotransporter adhesin